ncbi:MAG: lytic transglycosylase domain-containing protein [Proteobacteria bacterium]|nr:lytic transglycosylase domain-containing protein [Pseudomonadota bacterium]MBU4297795.1 lytic transglycosylase domain-containing protein [Pseudomonadota bacterium]
MSTLLRSWIIIAVLWALLPSVSFATMYTFVDENGVIHFSNVPNDRRYVKVNTLSRSQLRAPTPRYINPREYEHYIQSVGSRYQIDPLLIRAVIKAESNFDALALSCKGAQGLMQLMPGTARDMRVSDPFDPRENINGGTRYLRKMLNIFDDDLHLALAAYNAGPEAVKSIGRIPDFPETIEYVERVLRHYRRYQVASSSETGG